MRGCHYLFAAFVAATTLVNSGYAQISADVTLPSVAGGASSDVSAIGFASKGDEPSPGGMRMFRAGSILLGYRAPGDFSILTFKRAQNDITADKLESLMDAKKIKYPQKEVTMAIASIADGSDRYLRVGNGKSARTTLSLLQRKRSKSKAGTQLTAKLPANGFSAMAAALSKGAKTVEEDAVFGVASTDGGARIYAVANAKTGDGIVLIERPDGPQVFVVHDLSDVVGRIRGWFNGLHRVVYLYN